MASFFVTARTSSQHAINPDYYIHPSTVDFIERILGMDVEDFCLKLDAYSIAGLKGIPSAHSLILRGIMSSLGGKNDSKRRTEAKSEIRKLITTGLSKY